MTREVVRWWWGRLPVVTTGDSQGPDVLSHAHDFARLISCVRFRPEARIVELWIDQKYRFNISGVNFKNRSYVLYGL